MSVENPGEIGIGEELISRALHNLTNLGIVTTDADLRITGWNRWMEIHTGKPTTEVQGMLLTNLYPQLIERRHYHHYQQALEGRVIILAQRFHRYLFPMPHAADASGAPLMQQSARIAPLVDATSNIVGTLTIVEDVSERVNYDIQLQKHASRQLAISTLGQTALGGASLDHVFSEACRLTAATLDANLAAFIECEVNTSQLVLHNGFGWNAKHRDDKFGPTFPPLFANAFADSCQAVEVSTDDVEVVEKLRSEGVKGGICIAVPATTPPSRLLAVFTKIPRCFTDEEAEFLRTMAGIVAMAQDRDRLLQQLQSKIEDLAIADRRKDEFLAMLAHELRNPLAPITNATELLQKNVLDLTTREWATAVIQRQLLQITRLVDDLLDISRITRGKVALRKSMVNIGAVVARALETSQPLIESRRHNLHVDVPNEPLWIEADIARLAQVISNLLNNAAKYTDDGGTIRLTVERQNDGIDISVSDSGVGIPKEVQSTVFELFTQVSPSPDRKEGGLGIGLTLVRSLVTLHGGTVTVRSDGAGRGSKFTIHLPVAYSASQSDSNDPHLSTRCTQSKRVLIVDDNKDAADLMKLSLHHLGHDVTCVYDGRAALICIEQSQPEVVILDLGLPEMTGYEVAATVRERYGPAMVLVALTGYGQDDDRRRTTESGFDIHLVKPIAAAELDALFAKLRT